MQIFVVVGKTYFQLSMNGLYVSGLYPDIIEVLFQALTHTLDDGKFVEANN